jgi:sterol desaturase/sphingolipid hydroxylase (fatty acid hydroxylase superfamily)
LFMIFPVFTGAILASLMLYYYKHRRAHIDPVWGRKHLRWHYEHHLGENAGANWCVTWPWFDYLLGTRVKSKTLDCNQP